MKTHVSKCIKKTKSAPVPLLNAPASDDSQRTSSLIPLPRQTQPSIDKFVKAINLKSKDHIDKALGKCLFSSNTPFHILENPEFKEFIHLLNPAYVMPSHDKIGSTILNEVYNDVQKKMKEELGGTFGVLLQDGWSTNQNDAVIAHCIKSGDNIHFLCASTPGAEKSDAEYCFQEINNAMQMAISEFNCKIVGVVTDNCNTMLSLQHKINETYEDVEAYGCNAHPMNNLGKHFTPSEIKSDINEVQVYMKNHKFTVGSLKEMKANLPVLAGTTRWNSQLDCFLNYLENQANYLKIARKIDKPSGDKERKKLESVLTILNNSELYSKLDTTVKLLQPIAVALDKVLALAQWLLALAQLEFLFKTLL
jgi:hypothetical protein